jgi:hypothetical protein
MGLPQSSISALYFSAGNAALIEHGLFDGSETKYSVETVRYALQSSMAFSCRIYRDGLFEQLGVGGDVTHA